MYKERILKGKKLTGEKYFFTKTIVAILMGLFRYTFLEEICFTLSFKKLTVFG